MKQKKKNLKKNLFSEKLKNGDVILLQHLATGKFLHSHLHASPLTNQQEVSAYEGGDSGDNWQLLLQGDSWKSDSQIRLKHVDTGRFLQCSSATYGNPIPGQHEIAASTGGTPAIWTAAEGIYFPLLQQQ